MDFFNKIWKCIEIRESLQARRLSQIERLDKIVEKATPDVCPEITGKFFVSYLKFSIQTARVTVGNLDCEEASKQLDVIDAKLSSIEERLPLCGLTESDLRKIFA